MIKKELSKVSVKDVFVVADIEFIKFSEKDGIVRAVAKKSLFKSEFGSNNNLTESKVLKRLENDILPKIADEVGMENICDIHTDLTTLDGLKPYENLTSKISIPTFDFYRANVEIFDKYKLNEWWWLATPDTAQPRCEPYWVRCVTPHGSMSDFNCDGNFGVRPILGFVSSILVSCAE